MTIPKTLIQVVPEYTTVEADELWEQAKDLHPSWSHRRYQDPVNPTAFPRTSPYWDRCQNGAQLAGLIRLEALLVHGGFYVDADVELVRPLDDLLDHRLVAAYEDEFIIPDAVLGAEAGHYALHLCIRLAIARLTSTSDEERGWMTDSGAWATGPGVTTTILKGRDDVTLLPPTSFFPVWYAPRETLGERLNEFVPGPDTYGVHRWQWSWA